MIADIWTKIKEDVAANTRYGTIARVGDHHREWVYTRLNGAEERLTVVLAYPDSYRGDYEDDGHRQWYKVYEDGSLVEVADLVG